MLKKQIVFSDYDGTIYITEENMKQNIEAIRKYRNLGGQFVIITGRSKTSISEVIKKYSIPYDYIIANNGAIIIDANGNKIYEQTINVKILSKIIEYLKAKSDIEILYYDEDNKIEFKDQELLKIRARTLDNKTAKKIEKEINSLFGTNVIAHAAFPSLYYNDITFALVDIVSKNAGKERSIKQLIEMINIEKEQVITIGDGRNDIDMIKTYNGYSLISAEKEVKKVASKFFENIADALEDLMMKHNL